MRTKYTKALAVESSFVNCVEPDLTKPISITKDNMNDIVDELKQFVINRVIPLTRKHECTDNLLYFVNALPSTDYMIAKIEIYNGICGKNAYLDINIPSAVNGIEVPISEFAEKIHNMMKPIIEEIPLTEIEVPS